MPACRLWVGSVMSSSCDVCSYFHLCTMIEQHESWQHRNRRANLVAGCLRSRRNSAVSSAALCANTGLGSTDTGWLGKELLWGGNVGRHAFLRAWLLLNLTLATFVYPINSRLCTISLSWAAGCDWDYSWVHVQSRVLLGPCLVDGLLNSADDKVACQTRGKTNTSDSVSIYILLCNWPDLF